MATPIGNLGDISLRALETLAAADVIACEDSRVTRKLTEHYGIKTPLTPYHEHNAAEARPKLLARLGGGQAIALVSDAGTPLISDPGYKLVRAAADAGHTVIALPGASAVLAALGVAGLPTDRFFFEGFLPPKQAARQKRIALLSAIPASLVLFESGPRIAQALADLADGLGGRAAAICRELTKLHEEIRRDSLDDLARIYASGAETRGEFVIVIAPPADDETDADDDRRSAAPRARCASRSRTRSAKWRWRPAGRAARSISARSRSPMRRQGRARRRRCAMTRRRRRAEPQSRFPAAKRVRKNLPHSASAFPRKAAPPPG